MPKYSHVGYIYNDPRLSYGSISDTVAVALEGPDYYLYSMTDRSRWVMEPVFVRTRHRYRGPRQSLKMNLEMDSFRFDILRMRTTVQSLRERFESYKQILVYGGLIDLGDSNLLEVLGIYDLAARVNVNARRVKSLE